MADRVTVSPQTIPLTAYPATLPVGAGSHTVGYQAYDVGLMNRVTIVDGKTLILIRNVAVGAKTVTFLSVADSVFHRVGDITTYSVAAGGTAIFGPFKTAGWSNAGYLFIDAEDANITIANITLP